MCRNQHEPGQHLALHLKKHFGPGHDDRAGRAQAWEGEGRRRTWRGGRKILGKGLWGGGGREEAKGGNGRRQKRNMGRIRTRFQSGLWVKGGEREGGRGHRRVWRRHGIELRKYQEGIKLGSH